MEDKKYLPEHQFSKCGPWPGEGGDDTRITWEFRSSANSGAPPRPTESEILRWSPATCIFQEFHSILMHRETSASAVGASLGSALCGSSSRSHVPCLQAPQ